MSKPRVIFDAFGYWTVDFNYYGVRQTNNLAWVIEFVAPNTEDAARELAKLSTKINDVLNMKVVTGLSDIRTRMSAEKIGDNWKLTEYDFRRWTEII